MLEIIILYSIKILIRFYGFLIEDISGSFINIEKCVMLLLFCRTFHGDRLIRSD